MVLRAFGIVTLDRQTDRQTIGQRDRKPERQIWKQRGIETDR